MLNVAVCLLMPELVIETTINAPAEHCFQLVRDPRVHGETKVERDPESGGLSQLKRHFTSPVLPAACLPVIN